MIRLIRFPHTVSNQSQTIKASTTKCTSPFQWSAWFCHLLATSGAPHVLLLCSKIIIRHFGAKPLFAGRPQQPVVMRNETMMFYIVWRCLWGVPNQCSRVHCGIWCQILRCQRRLHIFVTGSVRQQIGVGWQIIPHRCHILQRFGASCFRRLCRSCKRARNTIRVNCLSQHNRMARSHMRCCPRSCAKIVASLPVACVWHSD